MIKLPNKHNTEDSIFNQCVMGIPEFPQYITSYEDIKNKAHTKILSEAYKNLNMDLVFERKNGALINIEHHSSLTKEKLARDQEYITTLYSATLKYVEQFIMYTGNLPVNKALYLNYKDTYSPNFFITKHIDGKIRLNNLKYKIENNEEITSYDVIDLIWIPTFRIDINKEDLIVELSSIYDKLIIPYPLSRVARKCLILWAGKYLKNSKKIKKVAEKLKMSITDMKPFEEQIRDAIIDGEITRAEEIGIEKGKEIGIEKGKEIGMEKGKEIGMEKGKEIGIEEGEKNIIKKMLKKYNAEEVSKITEIDIKQINEIKMKL